MLCPSCVHPFGLEYPSMSYIVLARKYRPKNFTELVGQSHVVKALTNALTTQRLHHAYLFTGTRGVGKTTVSRILAKSLNCEQGITPQPCGVCDACTQIDAGRFVDYTELDAASNRGVDEVQQLLEQAVYKPVQGRFKVFMIDEVHMLTNHAFNSMLKTLEEPPEYLKFVLATTDPQKVPVTVLSRCLQFNLRPMAPDTIWEHLSGVLKSENVGTEEIALQLIAQSARGSMRDALSLADQAIAFGGGELKEGAVRQMLGSVDFAYIFDLISALAKADGNAVFAICENIREMGVSAASTLEEMARVLQRMAVVQNVPNSKQIAHSEFQRVDPDAEKIDAMAKELPTDETQLLYSMCLQGRSELGLAPDEYTGLTMILLRLLAFKAPGVQSSDVPHTDEAAQKKTLKFEPLTNQSATEPTGAKSPAPRPNSSSAFNPEPTSAASRPLGEHAAPESKQKEATHRPEALALAVHTMDARRSDSSAAQPLASSSAQMISVPISSQIKASSALDIPKPGLMRELVMTAEGDFWSDLVFRLIESGLLHGLNRELALQSQLIGREADVWILRVESEHLNNKTHSEQLRSALKALGSDVQLQFEIGVVKDCPARRNIANNMAREQELLRRIQNDPFVSRMVREYNAKIIMGSIKAVEAGHSTAQQSNHS